MTRPSPIFWLSVAVSGVVGAIMCFYPNATWIVVVGSMVLAGTLTGTMALLPQVAVPIDEEAP